MKKYTIILLLLTILCGCSNKDLKEKEEVKEKQPTVEIDTYKDENNVPLGFYYKNNLLTTHECAWNQYKDITWIDILPTNDTPLTENKTKKLWNTYWENYKDKNYKFGIEISYTLNSGEKVDLTLLKPSDNASIFNYIQIYLYDGYNATTSWYDHLEDHEITDNTVFTSIKLTGSTYIDQVTSPITLSVFTYDTQDDFDPKTNKYRGNSKYTIKINKI